MSRIPAELTCDDARVVGCLVDVSANGASIETERVDARLPIGACGKLRIAVGGDDVGVDVEVSVVRAEEFVSGESACVCYGLCVENADLLSLVGLGPEST